MHALLESLTGGGTADLPFDRQVVQHLFDLAPPGLDELMALTRIVELLGEDRPGTLVIDTPPTGHLVRLLESPQLIQEWLPCSSTCC